MKRERAKNPTRNDQRVDHVLIVLRNFSFATRDARCLHTSPMAIAIRSSWYSFSFNLAFIIPDDPWNMTLLQALGSMKDTLCKMPAGTDCL